MILTALPDAEQPEQDPKQENRSDSRIRVSFGYRSGRPEWDAIPPTSDIRTTAHFAKRVLTSCHRNRHG